MVSPQVDKAFDGDEDVDTAPSGVKASVAALPADWKRKPAWARRHWCFVMRSKHKTPSTWRPQQWFRVSAKRWAGNVDLQVRTSTELGGLVSEFLRLACLSDVLRMPWLSNVSNFCLQDLQLQNMCIGSAAAAAAAFSIVGQGRCFHPFAEHQFDGIH